MTAEILIGVGLAALGGLCFLLWNTDGSLDVLAGVAGGAAYVAALIIAAHDLALESAATDLPMLSGALRGAVSGQIRSHLIGGLPVLILLGVGTFSLSLLPIMLIARRSRLKP